MQTYGRDGAWALATMWAIELRRDGQQVWVPGWFHRGIALA